MRRTSVTVISCEQRSLVGRCYTYDEDNRHLGLVDSMAPPWFHKHVRDILAGLPAISLIRSVEVPDPRTGAVFAGVLIERFLDATVGQVLDMTAARIPEQEAIVDMSSGRRVNYRELKQASDHMARVFLDLGVRRGDVIAVLLPNSLEQSITKLGLHKAGAVADNLSPHETCEGIKRLLRQTDATTLVLRPGIKADESIHAIYHICPELKSAEPGRLRSADLPCLRSVVVIGAKEKYPGTLSFEELTSREPRCSEDDLQERLRSISARDVATLIHTSGSTNTPKSVMLTHGTIIENALSHIEELGIASTDRILTPVPIFHALGGIGATLSAIVAGAAVVAMWKPKPLAALKALREERCSVLITVPSFALSLVETIRNESLELNGTVLDLCIMAGAECTPKMRRDVKETLGVRDVLIMYGMSEAGPGVASTRPMDPDEVKLNTVGRPWPGVEIRLANAMSSETGEDIGEICVRGYNLMRGYYKNETETSAAIDADGWLHTGDLGRLREDGNLVLCGRSKDIICHHGENISPREIEHYLETHPSIETACVVGARDYKSGEIICAFVRTVSPGIIEAGAVIDHCRAGLPSIKVPSHVCFLDEFPKSETGKILRRELQALAQEIHDAP